MKKVITESEIIKLIKSGQSEIILSKSTILTPLAKDKINSAKIKIKYSEYSVLNNKLNSNNKIAIGSDHTGFSIKKNLIDYLNKIGKTVIDVGTFDNNPCDYPDYASLVAKKILSSEVDFGIMIDATGIPSSITANKFKGIRAATCYNEFSAWSARNHNDANILVIGAKTLGEDAIKSIIDKWLTTNFEGGRHQKRLDKIKAIEQNNLG